MLKNEIENRENYLMERKLLLRGFQVSQDKDKKSLKWDDVFSFGVLLLGAPSSKKNTHFYDSDSLTLGHVSDKISYFFLFFLFVL